MISICDKPTSDDKIKLPPSINLYINRFREIRCDGSKKIPKEISNKYSNKRGNNVIGETLEYYLGIKRNSRSNSDVPGMEIKTSNLDTSTPITLFTKEPLPRSSISELSKQFVKINNKKNQLFCEVGTNRGNYGFLLQVIDNSVIIKVPEKYKIQVSNEDKFNNPYWNIDDLKKAFTTKYEKYLFYVKGKITENMVTYGKATLRLGPPPEKFLSLLKDNIIFVNLRVKNSHESGNGFKPSNYGTAFRIKPNDLCEYFPLVKVI